jgi:regulatory protein
MAAPPENPADARAAYVAGLRLLGARELSTVQIRQRLRRRGFEDDAVEEAVLRLARDGALDDGRVARARAHTETVLKHRGPARVRQAIEALGIDRSVAAAAAAEAAGQGDAGALLEQALERRLRHSRQPITNPAERRRVVAALVRQGFPAGQVMALLRTRARDTGSDDRE